MKVLKCGGCGAPFDEVPEDTAVQCEFCGAGLLERSRRKLPARPFYKGYMIYSKGEGCAAVA